MEDLLTEPYVEMKVGDKKFYKFTNGTLVYSEEEFKALLRKNIAETTEVKDEVKQEAKPINRGNKKKKSTNN